MHQYVIDQSHKRENMFPDELTRRKHEIGGLFDLLLLLDLFPQSFTMSLPPEIH